MQSHSFVRRSLVVALVGGLGLLASACSSDGTDASQTTAAETTAPETTVVETTAAETTLPETTAPESTDASDTSIPDGTGSRPDDAVTFDDPEGLYTTDVSPEWEAQSGVVAEGIEFWTVQPTTDKFANNVNIISQSADGRDLDGYLQFSLDNMGDYEVVDSGKIIGDKGNPLGYIEFTGDVPTSGAGEPLHFLALFSVEGDNVSLLTLTTTESTFNDVTDANAAYLLGLQSL